MNKKLNAEELAAKRFPEYDPDISPSEAYEEAVRYIAQPIADERDEFREALEEIAKEDQLVSLNEGAFAIHRLKHCMSVARAILAKYPSKP